MFFFGAGRALFVNWWKHGGSVLVKRKKEKKWRVGPFHGCGLVLLKLIPFGIMCLFGREGMPEFLGDLHQ